MSRKIRFGRRASMAVRASSELRAVRVEKPSSSRMPETSSRMSASSSTIRISLAMLNLRSNFRAGVQNAFALLLRARDGEMEAHQRAGTGRSVEQFDAAAMILENFRNDGKAEAGALRPRRHVGLQQPPPVFARKTLAI